MKNKIIFLCTLILSTTSLALLATENSDAFHSGFSMAQVKVSQSSTGGWSVSITGTTTSSGSNTAGSGITLSGNQTYTYISCCVNSNSGSACNFGNENSPCKTNITRGPHDASNQVNP